MFKNNHFIDLSSFPFVYGGRCVWIQLLLHGLKQKSVVKFWICFKGRMEGFANGSDTGCERKKIIKKGLKTFDLSNWKDGFVMY